MAVMVEGIESDWLSPKAVAGCASAGDGVAALTLSRGVEAILQKPSRANTQLTVQRRFMSASFSSCGLESYLRHGKSVTHGAERLFSHRLRYRGTRQEY